MSNAIVPVEQYAIAQMEPAELQEVITDNLGEGGGISLFDLPRVKVPSGGGTAWDIPSLEGSEVSKEIVGIPVFWEDAKDMWIKGQDEGGGGAAPDCSGQLVKVEELGISVWTGHGSRWEGDDNGPHDCATCPYEAFGSGKDGKGKKCKDTRIVAILRPGDMLPLILVLPTMSVPVFKKYCTNLLVRGIKYYGAVARFTLAKTQNKAGTTYSQVQVELVEKLDGDSAAKVAAYAKSIQPHLKRKARAAREEGSEGPASAFAEADMEEIAA